MLINIIRKRKQAEHLVNMKWFDIPILKPWGKVDNLCFYLMSTEQIVATACQTGYSRQTYDPVVPFLLNQPW